MRMRIVPSVFIYILPAACIVWACSDDAGASSAHCKVDESVSTVDIDFQIEAGDAGADASDDADAGASVVYDYTDLICFAYDRLDVGAYRLGIVNYWTECGGAVKAAVTGRSNDSVSVTVTPESCGSGCLCPRDFSLDVGDVGQGTDVVLTVERFSCMTWRNESAESATLPVQSSDKGLVCQYMGASIGGRHAPCHSDGSCDDEGLVCEGTETLSDWMDVCLVPCDTVADCPIPSAFQCDDGACHVLPGMTQSLL